MKKNIFGIIFVLVLIFSISACGKKRDKETKEHKPTTQVKTEKIINYEVSEDEFKASFDLIKDNYTLEAVIRMGDGSEEIIVSEIQKFNEEGYSNAYNLSTIMTFTIQEAVSALHIDNTLTGEALMAQIKASLDELVEMEEIDKYTIDESTVKVYPSEYSSCDYYLYIDDKPFLIGTYDYDDDTDSYMYIVEFAEEEDSIIDDMELKSMKDFYSALTYNENEKRYDIDGERITELLADGEVLITNAYIKFEDGKVSYIHLEGNEEGNPQVIDMHIYDYGKTQIDKVPENKIVECPHNAEREYITTSNDEYHAFTCDYCDTILRCEAHNYKDHDTCVVCSHTKTVRNEEVSFESEPSKYCSDHCTLAYNSLNELVSLDYNNFSYEGDYYVCEDCGLAFVYYYSFDESEGCVWPSKYTYKFFDINEEGNEDPENPTVFLAEYVEFLYSYSHDFEDNETVDAENGCRTNVTRRCSDCEFSYQYYYEEHNYELINTSAIEGCLKEATYKCSDCDKEYTTREFLHDFEFLGFTEKTSYSITRNFKCKECEFELEQYINIYYDTNPKTHSLSYSDFNDNYKEVENEPHTFNDEGICTLCGFDINEYVEIFNKDEYYLFIKINEVNLESATGHVVNDSYGLYSYTLSTGFNSAIDEVGCYSYYYMTNYSEGINYEIRYYSEGNINNFEFEEEGATISDLYIIYEKDGDVLSKTKAIVFYYYTEESVTHYTFKIVE